MAFTLKYYVNISKSAIKCFYEQDINNIVKQSAEKLISWASPLTGQKACVFHKKALFYA
jgi:hypothetical protein